MELDTAWFLHRYYVLGHEHETSIILIQHIFDSGF